MKKIIAVLALVLISACADMEFNHPAPVAKPESSTPNPVQTLKDLHLSCTNVKGVNDPEHGKVYYTAKHNLFKYVKIDASKGDRYFCTTSEAEKAGFKPAEAHFSGSVYYLVQCLHTEANDGECHKYISGIYQSLQIYDKVCGGNPSHQELAETVESYANREKDAMDSGKYEGTTAALINKYPCR